MPKVRLPAGSRRGIETILNERVRLERRALRELDESASDHASAVRDVIAALGAVAWSLQAHARVQKQLRDLGRRYGSDVSRLARKHARLAADLGVDQQPRALATLARAALRTRVSPPSIDVAAARRVAVEHVDLRTDDVGARAGEDVGAWAVSASYLEAQKASPATAVVLGFALAKALEPKARDRGALVVTTEITAGAEWGGDAARSELAREMPALKKVWDSTLDRRVCPTCAELHHTVVDTKDSFPGGYDDAPAHARCRCATLPWLDDWSDVLRTLGIGPGPRTGVLETAETRLASFTDRTPAEVISSAASERPRAGVTVVVPAQRHQSAASKPGPAVQPPPPPASPPKGPPPPPPSGGHGSGGRGPGRGLTTAEAEARGIALSHGARDLEAVATSVFGSHLATDFDELERIWSNNAFRAQVVGVSASGQSLCFDVHLLDGHGKQVGDLTRTFIRHPDERLQVHHDYFAINAQVQGGGAAKEMMRRALPFYERIGVDYVDVSAHWIGRYTWATAGFKWDAATARQIEPRLARYLMEKGGLPAESAAARARIASRDPLIVARLDVPGVRLDVRAQDRGEWQTVKNANIGKAFLLDDEQKGQRRSWDGVILVRPGDPMYEATKRELGL